MKLALNAADLQKWERLKAIRKENDRILLAYSRFLNETPCFLSQDLVSEFAADCGLPVPDAFRVLFSAACGLDTASNADDRRLERDYIRVGVAEADPTAFSGDDYCRFVRFPSLSLGKWQFREEVYRPFEAFVCGNPLVSPDYREIPRVAFFRQEFRFPAIAENGIEWMAVKPNEIETMRQPISDASGNVVTFGLGLGYFAFHVSQKPSVRSVTVVERDADLIALFEAHLLPQFPHREKIRVVTSDAFDYAQNVLPHSDADFVFADLWHDQSDGLLCYLRLKRLESLSPSVRFAYWVEPILLSSLRRMVFDRILAPDDGSGAPIRSFAEIQLMLSDSYLRTLAPNVRERKG